MWLKRHDKEYLSFIILQKKILSYQENKQETNFKDEENDIGLESTNVHDIITDLSNGAHRATLTTPDSQQNVVLTSFVNRVRFLSSFLFLVYFYSEKTYLFAKVHPINCVNFFATFRVFF